jgi:RNA recognition motif-containing protein
VQINWIAFNVKNPSVIEEGEYFVKPY